jgi:ABC-type lipoprotein release transport system permease subunit
MKNLGFAWRNLWRNKHRTIITSTSIFFGVLLSSVMTSMQEGSYEQYINTIVNSYSGHLQIHRNGYWDDKVINQSFELTPALLGEVKNVRNVTTIAPRFESYALASSAELTKGVMVMGIDPVKENEVTKLKDKIKEGQYLTSKDDGVILGSGTAKYLRLKVNDTLVLLSQGYHGVSAAGKYPVKGIIKLPSPELDRSVVYMDVAQCQDFFSAPSRLTSLVIMVSNINDVNGVKKELSRRLNRNYELMDWKELNQVLLKQIDSDRISGAIVKGILYLIISFGIFGTIMMMTLERRKEFGVLIALGMQKLKLGITLIYETLFIGLIGALSGILVSFPITLYFKLHPIPFTGQTAQSMEQMGFAPVMSFTIMPSVFYQQAFTILLISILIGFYPVWVIAKLQVNKAIRIF